MFNISYFNYIHIHFVLNKRICKLTIMQNVNRPFKGITINAWDHRQGRPGTI